MTELDAETAGPRPERGETGRREIVVVGASAGGLQALREIVPRLPEDLPAAVLVVVHLSPDAPTSMPTILARRTLLLTTTAADREPIEQGRIYIAPPDRHMLVEDGHVRLSHGPRENGHRPAIDPLFRTAARHYGPRVVGVVLSGNLSDGTVGLRAIDDHGGVTVVQDPSDALHPGMPGSAIEEVEPHYVLPAAEIADLIVRLAEEPVQLPLAPAAGATLPEPARGELANMSCPDCGGPLSELREGRMPFYACRVGHRFSTRSLFVEQADAFESALWTAIRVLEERVDLALRLAERLEHRGADLAAQRFRRTADETRRQAASLRGVVEEFDASVEAGPGEADVTSAAQGRTAGHR